MWTRRWTAAEHAIFTELHLAGWPKLIEAQRHDTPTRLQHRGRAAATTHAALCRIALLHRAYPADGGATSARTFADAEFRAAEAEAGIAELQAGAPVPVEAGAGLALVAPRAFPYIDIGAIRPVAFEASVEASHARLLRPGPLFSAILELLDLVRAYHTPSCHSPPPPLLASPSHGSSPCASRSRPAPPATNGRRTLRRRN